MNKASNSHYSSILKRFGFYEDPFAIKQDIRYYYPAKPHLKAFEEVIEQVDQRKGIITISGKPGEGKTILSKRLAAYFTGEPGCKVISPRLNPGHSGRYLMNSTQILRRVAEELPIPPFEVYSYGLLEISEYLKEQYQENGTVIWIIDDTFCCPDACRDVIIDLQKAEQEEQKLIQLIILDQQTGLKKFFRGQGIDLKTSIHLSPLSTQDAGELLGHRCEIAGRSNLFSAAAVSLMHHHSEGNPQKLLKLSRQIAIYLGFLDKLFADEDDIRSFLLLLEEWRYYDHHGVALARTTMAW